MDMLIKFARYAKEDDTGKENWFPSLKKVQKYFLKLHKSDGNNNFFFHKRKGRRFDAKDGKPNILNEDDNIYFVFKQNIVAKAIYVANSNPNRDDKFKHGYEVRNVILLGKPYPLSELAKNPFSNQNAIYYIKDKDEILKNELKEVFK